MLAFLFELKILDRAIASGILSFLLYIVFGRRIISFLLEVGLGQKISQWGPKSHFSKEGTPTAGGVFIWLFPMLSVILFGDLKNKYLWLSVLTFTLFTILGFIDDFMKKRTKARGLTISQKFLLQLILSAAIILLSYKVVGINQSLKIPFSDYFLEIPLFLFILFSIFIFVGSSNAVNLTDGLDGLAAGHLLVAFAIATILVYFTGHFVFADYLGLFFIAGIGEVTVLNFAILGALLGFLWFNGYPAQIFMGDSGSLSLGALLGYISIISKIELFLPIFGAIFVIEALSVIIQVSYFKITKGKRIFKMAPIHHHFEISGIPEPKVVVRFIISAIIFGGLALLGLKIK